MTPPRAILAPTDFSEHAAPAVAYAAGLAAHFGAALHLIHVLPDVVPVGPDPNVLLAMPPEYYAQTEAQSLDALRAALPEGAERPRSIEYHVRWGSTVDGVITFAAEHGIDLIVIATHGRTGFRHMLMGSVAERIVREAPCPVLTIRSTQRSGSTP